MADVAALRICAINSKNRRTKRSGAQTTARLRSLHSRNGCSNLCIVIANDIGHEGWLELRVRHRTMRKLWIGCFILTAVVFLLQVSPIPGVFLMFLLAPYWSVVTINLGFALMVLDGLVGSLPKPRLVFPAIWFVGYAAAAGVSHFEAHKLAVEVLSENSGQFLPFDAQRDQLLVEPDSLRQDTAFSIDGLMENYDLNTVYQRFYGNPKCPNVQMVGLRSSGCGRGADVVDKDINGCPTITNEIVRWNGPYINSSKVFAGSTLPCSRLHRRSH
jgi:hypothetical protein